jgi:hypothetical protein
MPGLASPPSNAWGGVGGVTGWVLPCPSSLQSLGWGRRARDSPYKWQLYTYLMSQAMSPGPFIPNRSPYPTLTAIAFDIKFCPILIVCNLSLPCPGSLATEWSPHPASYGSPGRIRSFGSLMTASPKKFQSSLLTCQVLSHIFKWFLHITEVYYPLRLSPID